ncbi:MAG: tRNA (uridine(34)/cytosine(34)/5-carboxymethylaminomethyluridine(34)-2'-O)-methyltransferase TrmL [Elusimicrobia bacterium GWC2_51_8]|nr:MAG: tRNA (uridine(34)/cytosine(34)/5-carboxymethylaminomethyluridine(34)-2'-O)-methyltransferase TrmL [Elusimicrobia bacterium GWA2_51_34]OGR58384.1 MAG: tRNA (uridine(34)/cytosine(34)/5-carboxymethylaminomethyluridine(34)-2'-O)-methyltransferase TrmL [Elusimicrobia bacterium GWC2_51_8]OGR86418.1 MAG: tRNA (uridine(34)/cytosine(34)/5-carboxymethylaminomethyluridine(34)-2'-O)-methyltransferase TrmL [Elusimicrobia bacterium GWF2_52_66]HAF96162.1 tRNA (uridine(34)/cytosine(34)/5-carboxymethylam
MKIVLINPDIPWNAGNIGRTCAATGTELAFVGKMGFKINSKEIRRSGLDYWQYLKYSVHPSFEEFLNTLGENPQLIFFSTKGEKTYWDAPYRNDSCLVFGSEGAGLPLEFYRKYKDSLYRIPMVSKYARSLNLSTSAGVALYEGLRRVRAGQCVCP